MGGRRSKSVNGPAGDAKNAKARAKHAADPRATRQYGLKHRFGISIEDYEALLARQGGHCALCDRTPEQEHTGLLMIDHCHETKTVRGLLCFKHNRGLGVLGDNEDGLMRALAYLRKEGSHG